MARLVRWSVCGRCDNGRLMVLHLHPWIMGQPWRIRHLDEVLGHICAHQGVWKATGGEIIDWFKARSG